MSSTSIQRLPSAFVYHIHARRRETGTSGGRSDLPGFRLYAEHGSGRGEYSFDDVEKLRQQVRNLEEEMGLVKQLLLRKKEEGQESLKTRTLASKDVQDFWEALPRAKLDGNLLRLEAGSHFLGDHAFGDRIFVREYWYNTLIQRVEEHFGEEGSAVGIVGSTGIGRSFFGYYLLYKWCLEGKSVIVKKAGWRCNSPYLFCKDGVFQLNDNAFLEEIYTSGNMYLLDSLDPMTAGLNGYGCKMVFIGSLEYRFAHGALKDHAYEIFWMDTWSKDELHNAVRLLYPNMTDTEFQRRYYLYGGNARYVLSRSDNAGQAYLDLARNDFILRMRPLDTDLVLHACADTDFTARLSPYHTFASEYVKYRLTQAAVNQHRYDFEEYFRITCPGIELEYECMPTSRSEAIELLTVKDSSFE